MKLTDEHIAKVRRISSRKRRLLAMLRSLPTSEELAWELHCSPRHIERIAAGETRKVPRETPGRPTLIDESFREMASMQTGAAT